MTITLRNEVDKPEAAGPEPPVHPAPNIGQQHGEVVKLSERRKFFEAALRQYIAGRRDQDDALKREQIGVLNSINRLIAQRQSLLDNTAHFYAVNSRADVSMGVLTTITLLSDNNAGCCTLSVTRMADFLSRAPRTIYKAIAKLKKEQLIFAEPIPGKTTQLWPHVHKAFGCSRDALTWILDLRAPPPVRGKPGRPKKDVVSLAQEIPQRPDLTPTSKYPCAIASAPLENTPDPKSKYLCTLRATDTTRETAEEEKKHKVTFDALNISDQSLNAFNDLFNKWGSRPEAIMLQTASCRVTNRLLHGELKNFDGINPEVLQAAFVAAFNTVQALYYAPKQQGPRDSANGGGSAMLSYFRKTLRTTVDDIRLRQASLEAKARSENAIQQELHANRLHGIQRRGTRRSGTQASTDELADAAFAGGN